MTPDGVVESPMGERMTRVETRLDHIGEALADLKTMLNDQNIAVRQAKQNNRATLYTVVALMFAIPSTVSASIAVYHLAEPSHTIVQNLHHGDG
jgi:hypothetical protein